MKILKIDWSLASVCFAVFFLVIFSCKKENNNPPVVNIDQPLEGAMFNVYDTVVVHGNASDDNELQNVSVTLENENYIPVEPTVSVTIPGNDFNFTTSFIIDNTDLGTGYYFIKLTAFDGDKVTTFFRKIFINAIPKVRSGIYLVTTVNNLITKISSMDSLHNLILLTSFSGDYSSSAISGKYHTIFTNGVYSGSCNAYDVSNHVLRWSIPPNISSFPYFEKSFYSKGTFFLSFYDGDISGLDIYNNPKFTGQTVGAYYPKNLFVHENFLAVEKHAISGTQKKIVLYFLSTAQPIQETAMDMDVEKIFSKNSNEIFVFGNAAGQGKMEIYDVDANGFFEPHTLPTGKIYSVVQIDHLKYLIAHETGIYFYDYAINSLTTFNSYIANHLEFDDVNNEVFAASVTELKVFDFTTSSLKYSVTAPDTIADVRILFNKD